MCVHVCVCARCVCVCAHTPIRLRAYLVYGCLSVCVRVHVSVHTCKLRIFPTVMTIKCKSNSYVFVFVLVCVCVCLCVCVCVRACA